MTPLQHTELPKVGSESVAHLRVVQITAVHTISCPVLRGQKGFEPRLLDQQGFHELEGS